MSDVMRARVDVLRKDRARYKAELNAALAREERYRNVYEWLSENMPRALELCPYKIDGRHLTLPKGEA